VSKKLQKTKGWNQPPIYTTVPEISAEDFYERRVKINRDEAKYICHERQFHQWVHVKSNVFSNGERERVIFTWCTVCGKLSSQWVINKKEGEHDD